MYNLSSEQKKLLKLLPGYSIKNIQRGSKVSRKALFTPENEVIADGTGAVTAKMRELTGRYDLFSKHTTMRNRP